MVVFALIAGGFALALLVVIYWRTSQRYEERYEGLKGEVDRLRVVQKDMSSDVRVRLEEGEQAREQELHARHERLEALEGRVAEAETELRAALASGAEQASERNERIENAVRTLRNAADARLADLSARLSQIETSASEGDTAAGDERGGEAQEAARNAQGSGETKPDTPGATEWVGAAQATSEGDRGTPMEIVLAAGSPSGGRWLVVLLALVAGIALLVTALA